jgi:hypothetical protein
MAAYRFLTAWLLDGDPIDVWNAIYEVEHWPEWWQGVERVERLAPGDDNGVGQAFRNRWRSRRGGEGLARRVGGTLLAAS